MKKYILFTLMGANIIASLFAQSAGVASAPLSANAGAMSKLSAIPINYYSGIPSIAFPLYTYSHHNGLNLDISLSYFGGGMRVNESATTAGFGWNINAGGMITRTLRGMPDDINANGFLYSPAFPADYRPNATKYFYDSVDAEQDIFQFNFNGRSGKFFIGKNKQIVIVPLSKLKITYTTSAGNNSPINSFTIASEDGVKYIFGELESQTSSFVNSGYTNIPYTTSWYLTNMISPLGKDTIKFNYNKTTESHDADVDGIEANVAYVSGGVIKKTGFTSPSDYTATIKKIGSIVFPDKKSISFVYDKKNRYDGTDSVLDKIIVSDSITRFGYLFNWNSSGRNYLNGLTYFTGKAQITLYQFLYSSNLFPSWGSGTIGNSRDYWGFYNGQSNSTDIPTVSGIYTGANRQPYAAYSVQGCLNAVIGSLGDTTRYWFEPNDIVQYSTVNQITNINSLSASTSSNVTFNQLVGNQNSVTMSFDNSVSRTGPNPFSGSCILVCKITSLDGLTTYSTYAPSLNQIYYVGSAGWGFTVPNGNYKLTTSLSGCSSSLSSASLNFTWQNQVASGTAATSGGIRIKQISHYDPYTEKHYDTIATYKYITIDGKSSGFLSTIPKYDYPYSETVINGSTTTTSYTAIATDPVNVLSYAQGSPVGYSRVEVIKGSPTHNIGKEVYEFTNLTDANSNAIVPSFPYAPTTQRDWAMGLPKRISVYDSAGTLQKITTNTFTTALNTYATSDFQSLKLGKTSRTYNGDPNTFGTPKTEYFTGAYYYPESGRSDLTVSVDSVYHPDGSIQVTQKTITYDANYNVIKTVTPYNKTNSLTLEQRIYYPYNYTLGGAIGKLRDSAIINTPVSTETWITGDATPRIANASIMDFQQIAAGNIKPLTLYTLQSNAPVAQSTIGAFDPAILVRSTTYLKAQKNFVSFDSQGNLLESKNAVSGQSASVIMDYGNQFPVAQVANAKFADIAYTSFESDGSGNWAVPSNLRDYTTSASGKACYNLSNGSISKSGLNSSISYIVSVWCKSGAVVGFNGQPIQFYSQHSDGWALYLMTLSGITSVTVSGSGLIDELRLYPKDANMTSLTYEPMVGITSTDDANSTLNYTVFDELNRPKLLLDKDKNIVKKYEYGMPFTPVTASPNWQLLSSSCTGTQQKRTEKDVNQFSASYDSTRISYSTNCVSCPPTCNLTDPTKKVVGCACETGQRYNISSVYRKVDGVNWKWVCTYKYCWSDGTTSSNSYTENNDSSCPVTAPCSL